MSHLPSDKGVELVRPEPMARKMRTVIGNLTRTMQFSKEQAEGLIQAKVLINTNNNINSHEWTLPLVPGTVLSVCQVVLCSVFGEKPRLCTKHYWDIVWERDGDVGSDDEEP